MAGITAGLFLKALDKAVYCGVDGPVACRVNPNLVSMLVGIDNYLY